MNPKTLILPFLSLAFIFSITPVSAEEKKPIIPVIKNTQIERKEIKTETKNEIKNIKEEQKSKLTTLKQKSVNGIYQSIKNSLVKKYDFLTTNKAKIDAKISQKESRGVDVTDAKTKLAQYATYSEAYTKDLAALDAKIQTILNSDKPMSLVSDLKASTNKVRSDLNSMHRVLTETLTLLVQKNKL